MVTVRPPEIYGILIKINLREFGIRGLWFSFGPQSRPKLNHNTLFSFIIGEKTFRVLPLTLRAGGHKSGLAN
jgi:hypothetical protein